MDQHGGVVTPAAGKRGGRRDDHGSWCSSRRGGRGSSWRTCSAPPPRCWAAANFGASYKATLLDGPPLVVKRFKDMNGVGREDFSEHMRRLGQLVHPNLLPVIAYLYKKEEKLLVTDYMANGSLAHVLHGGKQATRDIH